MAKNWHLKKRGFCRTTSLVLIPFLVMIIALLFRGIVSKENKDPEHYFDDPGDNWFLFPNLTDTSLATVSDPIDITDVTTMEAMAIKLIRRGHILAISPDRGPFFDNSDPSSFSSTLNRLISQTREKFNLTDTRDSYVTAFGSLSSMDSYVQSDGYPDSRGFIEAGIGFESDDVSASSGVSYSIRMNQSEILKDGFRQQIPLTTTEKTFDLTVQLIKTFTDTMYNSGFLALQNYIDHWAIGYLRGDSTEENIRLIPFPTPEHIVDAFATIAGALIPILFAFAFMWVVMNMIKDFVFEKEFRIKEGMKIIGLFGSSHFTSWFLHYTIINLVTSILITITAVPVFPNSDLLFIFFFFWIFMETLITFSWLVSSLFNKTSIGATLGALLFLVASFAVFGIGDDSTRSDRLGACVSSPACFIQGFEIMLILESNGAGVTTDTVGIDVNETISINDCFGFLILDFFMYLIVALYLERVIPTEWGTHEKPWFFLLPSWWCGTKKETATSNGRIFGDYYEEVDRKDSDIGVSIKNLSKRFGTQTEEEAAVKQINIDMYEGDILALLGHNGAGKTTAINMITGMLPPSSGDALVFGRSINRSMRDIRVDLGLCPQHNILWDDLTVYEHLVLFGRLKEIRPFSVLNDECQKLIEEVGLTEKKDVLSRNLSGGMKRKLSVAMALIGGSRCVVLDEPTSGVDPYSRRNIWEMIRKNKEGRVVILTTHFMDEADYLGDRIAIMDRGRIVACGSSLYLKNQFGVGYSVTITKHAGAERKKIEGLIKSHVSSANVLSDAAGEISFQLPKEEVKSFPELFDHLDESLEDLNIEAYVISMTTMEEVFLRVGHGAAEAHPEAKGPLSMHSYSKRSKQSSSIRRKIEETKVEPAKLDHDFAMSHTEYKREGPENNNLENAGVCHLERQATEKTEVQMDVNEVNDDHAQAKKRLENALENIQCDLKPVSSMEHTRIMLRKRWDNTKRTTNVWLWQLVYPTLILVAGIGLIKLALANYRQTVGLSTSQYNTPNMVPLGENGYPLFASVYDSSSAQLVNATTPSGNDLTQTENCQFTDNLASNDLDLSRYLLCTWDVFKQTRYGGYGNISSSQDVSSLFFNTTATWGAPVYLNLLNNARLRATDGVSSSASINADVTAWPRTNEEEQLSTSFVAVIIAIAFAFMPANIARVIVQERQSNSKHLQIISGVPLPVYWISNFIWDFVLILPVGLLSLAWYNAYDIEELTGEASGALVLNVVLYSLSIITFTYPITFCFESEALAQNTILMIYIVVGCILLVVSAILSSIPSTQDLNDDTLKFIFRLFPSFCFGEVIMNLLVRNVGQSKDIWDLDITGYPMIYMTWEFFFYAFVLFVIEWINTSPFLHAYLCAPRMDEESMRQGDQGLSEDVIEERKRVQEKKPLHDGGSSDAISIKGLRKVYSNKKVAVKDLWFGVPTGQCFGFLGTNGAGKTTTMKMLTGDAIPTLGTATLNDLDILTHQTEVRKSMGYCPQFDALLPMMTGRETLRLFAAVKGISDDTIEDYVERMIDMLSLTPFADKPCGGYSGGNMRKLSVGIALVGAPAVVFLDEPSTGMDPVSRRFMWDLITFTMAKRSVILTTHSMEECEALCGRIGIMVSGQLRCIGTIPHLKKVYAAGYQINVKVKQDRIQSFRKWIKTVYADAKLVEDQHTNMTYQVCQEQKSALGPVFRTLEENRNKQGIEEYSVSEVSLEQIFISFAREQEEEKGVVDAFRIEETDKKIEEAKSISKEAPRSKHADGCDENSAMPTGEDLADKKVHVEENLPENRESSNVAGSSAVEMQAVIGELERKLKEEKRS